MSEGLRLFRDRLVGLVVGVVLLARRVVAAVLPGAAAVFELEIERLLAALAYWGIGMPVGVVLGFGLGGLTPALGPRGMWVGLIAGLVVAAVLCFVQVYGIARAHDPWGWLLWFGS